jgi:threonine/homoserine/homoserine lactone efflux protein
MSAESIAQGVLIGLSIAAPVGPIGLLCIQRTLNEGMRLGLVTGLGAACADGVYGAVAGFGLGSISSWLVSHASVLGIVGGLYLIYLGQRTIRVHPAEARSVQPMKIGAWAAFASTFFLTLTNPMTILSFVAIFAGLGIGLTSDRQAAIAFVGAVVGGSALWWVALSSTIGLMRTRVGPKLYRTINAVSGWVLIAFGGYALWTGATT